MQIIDSEDVYSYIVTDQEWYGVNIAARDELVKQCHGAAKDRGRRFASIFVQPDALLPISPVPTRHCVWKHTEPLPVEDQLYRELMAVVREYVGKGEGKLSITQAKAIAERVFG